MSRFEGVQNFVVVELSGQAYRLNEAGQREPLELNQPLLPGTQLITEGDSILKLQAGDSILNLPSGALVSLPGPDLNLQPDGGFDLEELQQSILDGVDPTLAFQEAAAGETVTSSSNIGGQYIARNADETLAQAGFDTGSLPDTQVSEEEDTLVIIGPELTLSGTAIINESAGSATYTITLDKPSSEAITVTLNYSDISASGGGLIMGTL
ncbi:retention module-containing protein [Dongshaea marina]|uniref:retention module-containing protein n=1 Tax=Dongshaea marina TaxID=2047966 RepID=UPI000D3E5077|nr:retention module-containing protein [Dongshaea marina]